MRHSRAGGAAGRRRLRQPTARQAAGVVARDAVRLALVAALPRQAAC
jgi:hypothetical protein